MKDSAERGHGGGNRNSGHDDRVKHGYLLLDARTLDGEKKNINAEDVAKIGYSSIGSFAGAAPPFEHPHDEGDNGDGIGRGKQGLPFAGMGDGVTDLRLASRRHVAIPISYFCVGFLGRYVSHREAVVADCVMKQRYVL